MIERASRRAGAIACVLTLATGGCGDGTRPPDAEPSISMLDPRKSHYGNDESDGKYSDWAIKYMQWQFGTPASVLLDVRDCVAGQDPESDVVFLEAGLAARTEPNPCVFGSDKAIFLPLLSLASPVIFAADSAWPPHPEEEVLKRLVRDSMNDFDPEDVSVVVDDKVLREPLSGRIEPTGYFYTPYPDDNLLYRYGARGFQPVIDPAVVGGYWVLLAPLARGPHEISISVQGDLSGTPIRSEMAFRLMLD